MQIINKGLNNILDWNFCVPICISVKILHLASLQLCKLTKLKLLFKKLVPIAATSNTVDKSLCD
jgi:hypothetical protein